MKKINKQNISENRSCTVLHSVLHSPHKHTHAHMPNSRYFVFYLAARVRARGHIQRTRVPISTITLRYDMFYTLPSLAPISFCLIFFFFYTIGRTEINETRIALALQHLFSISSFRSIHRESNGTEFVSIFLAHVGFSERKRDGYCGNTIQLNSTCVPMQWRSKFTG